MLVNPKKIPGKDGAPGFELWWVTSHCTILPLDYKPIHVIYI
jgi:hypothetical protein